MSNSKIMENLNKLVTTLQGEVSLFVEFYGTSEIYSFQPEKQFWAASLVKVPLALSVYKKAGEDKIDLSGKIKIKKENFVLGSGLVKLLDKHNEYSYLDLIKFMLTISDNSATNQLFDFTDQDYVEKYMKEIGLKNTTVRHKMMIKAGRGPNLTTSRDMSVLLKKMYNNELPGSKEILEIMVEQLDRSRIPLLIPNEITISHKFGTLEHAFHEIGIVNSKNPFSFCFLSDDQEDKKLTNDVLSKAAKMCFDYSQE